MPIATIPLSGAYINRNADPVNSVDKDQFLVNAYPEATTDSFSNSRILHVNKRPGFLASSALTGVALGTQGACYQSGANKAILSYLNNPGTTTSVWEATGPTKQGSDIANTAGCRVLTETSISGTANLVGYFVDSGTSALEAWYYPAGGAWTQITDSDFPANLGTPDLIVGSPAHIDGYMLVLTASGKLYNSTLNSLSDWSAQNYLSASLYPDQGMDLAKYKNMAVVFGTRSIEFFRNAGNPFGSPFSRIVESSINLGIPINTSARRKVLEVDGTVYFIGVSPESGKCGVYRLAGSAVEKVSNPAIDKLCSTQSASDGISGIVGAFHLHGQSHIMFSTYESDASGAAPAYCYASESGYWWKYLDANSNIVAGLVSLFGANFFSSGTKIYYHGLTTPFDYKDATVALTVTIQTEPHVLNRGESFHINSVELIADNQSSGNTTIATSRDDYATFSTARNFSMTRAKKKLWSFGRFDNHVIFKLTHADNTPWRGQVLLVDWEPTST